MIKYKENEQLVKEIKKILIDENITQTEIANKLNIPKQNFNKVWTKKNLNCDDMKKILDICGYDILIDFKKKK